ncbi:Lipopolysaccharide export system ATP-binding protein LptB OS=Lysinibacillus sphaericus OX=1421 GN=lptB_1 PE=4 SV=1 [Lysinibacillus sphaericus]
MYFKGQSLAQASSVERTRMGLGRSFQITNVFPNLTVLENVRLAVQSKEKIRYQMFRHLKVIKQLQKKRKSY